MKRAWVGSGPLALVALALGAFAAGACGGTSEAGGAAGAGTSLAGAGAGASLGGAGASSGGSGLNAGGAGANTAGSGAGNAGSGTLNGGASSAGGPNPDECEKTECGPQLGLPNWMCVDGSVGGPTGRCLRHVEGGCEWEVNNCPRAGEGGGSSQGGQGNVAGTSGTAGAASDCGGCAPGEICVFQNGGPGPSHFVCAMQNPCGAGAACACIVGQGTCQPNLMGDPPRYCSCDNGLN
ncbi:MAG TPA: hypothetical protein VFK05_01635 [Polyangiaceae bacterium]|nr:hypothetical protein [Polyangiaceae bacterium]